MRILFINGSPNEDGKTAALAKELMKGKDYKTLNLVNYKVYSYGQEYPDDQFGEVLSEIKESETIVIGSPLYWHNICGSIRNFLDRCYGPLEQGSLVGRRLVFVFQGASPEKWMLEAGEYTMIRFARLYGIEYLGMTTDYVEVKSLSKRI